MRKITKNLALSAQMTVMSDGMRKNKSKKRKGIFTLKVFLFPVFFFFRIEKYLFSSTRIFFSNWTIGRAEINCLHRRCSWSKFAVAQCFAIRSGCMCARQSFVVTTSINDFFLLIQSLFCHINTNPMNFKLIYERIWIHLTALSAQKDTLEASKNRYILLIS